MADALVANLNGDFYDELELNAEFAASLDADVVAGAVVETSDTADGVGPAASESR